MNRGCGCHLFFFFSVNRLFNSEQAEMSCIGEDEANVAQHSNIFFFARTAFWEYSPGKKVATYLDTMTMVWAFLVSIRMIVS